MTLVLSYLRHHRWHLMMLALFGLIFAGVFWLYDLPMESVLYAAILFTVVGLIFAGLGFYRYIGKRRMLKKMQLSVDHDISTLPRPLDGVEEDYQALIKTLFDLKAEQKDQYAAQYRELNDYYTLWAHQIKTPIAAMKLLLQSGGAGTSGGTGTSGGAIDEEALSEQLFSIEQYVEIALNYLRVESLSSDLLIRRYALDDMVRQAVRKYAKLFIRKKIALELKECPSMVLTDEKWLVFVLEQLLSNALKYTHRGKISIYEEPGSVLVIEDTGIGIRPEDVKRVFERGYTGINGREDKRATGVGLYLCRQVLKKLSHEIEIESRLGEGTRVLLRLDRSELDVE